jgi:hypothetical protein
MVMNLPALLPSPGPRLAHFVPVAEVDLSRPLLWISIGLGVVVIALGICIYRMRQSRTSAPSADELRGKLAQAVTTWAMLAMVILAGMIIAISGYRAAVNGTPEASREFIETAKYVFAVVVPVVAGWVGTVMAFYFGKENFKAATESFSQMARQLTSADKLGQTRAQEIGKVIGEVDALRMGAADKTDTITLDNLEVKMTAKAPPFERLPVLAANGAPLMVVHRSVLNDFLLTEKGKDPTKNSAKFTLEDLVKAYRFLSKDSFATVGTGASAADAKSAMERVKGCSDVFVTSDGTPASAAIRWITNVDLLQAAQV